MHVHILGICGTLMGSIAMLAKALGHHVSGSDENVYPPMSDQLASLGIPLSEGYSASNIPPDVDLVMIGNANLPRGNDAVEYVLDHGIAYTSGAEWLGRYLLQDRWVIAIAGTHGKTTTTSMVAWILEYAGLAPGFLIGGVPGNFDGSARLGDTPFFVIEADEYDTSYFDRRSKFLHYRPRTLVIGNLEYDHADIFVDLAAIQYQFHLLLRTVPGSGLIIHGDDPAIETVFDMGCWTPRLRIGGATSEGATSEGATSEGATSEIGSGIDAHVKRDDGSEFEVLLDGTPVGTVSWQLTGSHNIENALAAVAASRHVGVEPTAACEALSTFKGVKRRMEKIFTNPAITVYDDFAHHPTAIEKTLAGLRARVGDESILAVIEPRSHTMRKGTHEKTLKASVKDADRVIWFKPDDVAWPMEERLGSEHTLVMDSVPGIHDAIVKLITTGTVRHVVIMSNGGFGGLREKLIETLASQA